MTTERTNTDAPSQDTISNIPLLLFANDIVADLNSGKVYRKIDEQLRELQCLTPKQLELVTLLWVNLTNGIEGTTRESIINELWKGGYISPESVTQIISRTRIALHDADKTIITNKPGRGYSLGEFKLLEREPDLQHKALEQFNSSKPIKFFIFQAVLIFITITHIVIQYVTDEQSQMIKENIENKVQSSKYFLLNVDKNKKEFTATTSKGVAYTCSYNPQL